MLAEFDAQVAQKLENGTCTKEPTSILGQSPLGALKTFPGGSPCVDTGHNGRTPFTPREQNIADAEKSSSSSGGKKDNIRMTMSTTKKKSKGGTGKRGFTPSPPRSDLLWRERAENSSGSGKFNLPPLQRFESNFPDVSLTLLRGMSSQMIVQAAPQFLDGSAPAATATIGTTSPLMTSSSALTPLPLFRRETSAFSIGTANILSNVLGGTPGPLGDLSSLVPLSGNNDELCRHLE